MGRHSKNNTAGSAFTYAERQQLSYGSKKTRLGNESLRAFDSCTLCLQTARNPQLCGTGGHLYCKECIYADLLAQKQSIQRQQVLLKRMKAEDEASDVAAREKARQRTIEDFEKSQNTVIGRISSSGIENQTGGSGNAGAGTKRKFDLDHAAIAKVAKASEDEAVRRIEKEDMEARKAKLPNFWLPSLTPAAAASKPQDIELKPLCFASDPPHPISRKSLWAVYFGEGQSCTTCQKTLSNNVKTFALKPCGHIVCTMCKDKLVQPSDACPKCDTELEKKKGVKQIIEIRREGTGFSAGGLAEAKKYEVAFQA